MNALAKLVVNRSKIVLFGFVALILLSTVWGFQSFGSLKGGGYDNPGSDSGVVARALKANYNQVSPDVVMVVDFRQLVDARSSVGIAKKLTEQLRAQDSVTKVSSYFTAGRPASLKSIDGKAAYFFVNINQKAKVAKIAQGIQEKFQGLFHGAEVYVAGGAVITSELNSSISNDLSAAESVAVPVVMVLLLFVFGSVIAAGLPFLVAALAALGSFFCIWVASQTADTSVFGINLVTGLSLGLGIDYALLIVNRFREERASGKPVSEAVTATLKTAGRTVFFSGLTVAVVMVSLAFFPQYFLRTFAVAGVSVIVFAVLGALLALPALLNIIGDRVNKWKVVRGDLSPKETGLWEKLSRFVMKRPLPILVVVLIGLGGLTSLAADAKFGLVDDRILPKSNSVVISSDQMRTRFSGREGAPIEVLLRNPSKNQLIEFTNDLSKLTHIVRVQSVDGITQNGTLDSGYAPYFSGYSAKGFTRVVAIADIDSRSTAGMNLIQNVRAIHTKIHYVKVGGSAASYTDSMYGITSNLPWAILWLVATTLILLFLFTGSVILPIKAVLLNFLSLGATLGFITWVFQHGNLHWLIGDFQVTGTLDTSSMVLVAVMAFGLSMDYELFLLSRIKEQHDRGLGTTDSVSYGLQHSGRIITAAALVLAVSFFAFTTSGVSIMKMLGLGVAFAILLDATVVRALLVPALMRLFGELNWWAPRWLKAVYAKLGLAH